MGKHRIKSVKAEQDDRMEQSTQDLFREMDAVAVQAYCEEQLKLIAPIIEGTAARAETFRHAHFLGARSVFEEIRDNIQSILQNPRIGFPEPGSAISAGEALADLGELHPAARAKLDELPDHTTILDGVLLGDVLPDSMPQREALSDADVVQFGDPNRHVVLQARENSFVSTFDPEPADGPRYAIIREPITGELKFQLELHPDVPETHEGPEESEIAS